MVLTFSRWEQRVVNLPRACPEARSIEQHYETVWENLSKDQQNALEQDADDESINNGVPSEAMAQAVEHNMSWQRLVQAGVCTPSFAITKFTEQLNNLTLISVLLAGFAIGFAVSPEDYDSDYPVWYSYMLQGVYGISMLASGMYNFAATVIALHTANRLSNACPSKSSTAYMTVNVFKPARTAIQDYVFRGIIAICIGLTAVGTPERTKPGP